MPTNLTFRVVRASSTPHDCKTRRTRAAGFTLIELIVVLTLAGVLAAVAGPRFFERGVFDERGYYDQLASALRYAQKLAVASGCPVRATVTATGYTLGQQTAAGGHCDPSDTTFANAVLMPDSQTMVGTAPPGVTVAPAATVVFRAAGDTDLPGNQLINVGSRTLTIVASSGLVQAP